MQDPAAAGLGTARAAEELRREDCGECLDDETVLSFPVTVLRHPDLRRNWGPGWKQKEDPCGGTTFFRLRGAQNGRLAFPGDFPRAGSGGAFPFHHEHFGPFVAHTGLELKACQRGVRGRRGSVAECSGRICCLGGYLCERRCIWG